MIPLRDPARRTRHTADDFGHIPRAVLRRQGGRARRPTELAARSAARGCARPPSGELSPGSAFAVEAGETVTAAPELARLTLNPAMAHTDATGSSHGRRLVYGGQTIAIAAAHATRAIPAIATILAWQGCDHLGPVFEGDVLRTEIARGGRGAARDGGGLAALRASSRPFAAAKAPRAGTGLELPGAGGLSEGGQMAGILDGMRIIEGSAFVAVPLGGMAMAQLGADVIRFDPIGGGLDRGRWPVTTEGKSLFWAGLNKGKRSIQIDLRSDEGRELIAALITAPGPDAGLFLTNFPARGFLDFDALSARRRDLMMVNIVGNHDGSSAVDYTVNPATGFPWATGPRNLCVPFNHLLPAWDAITGHDGHGEPAGRRAPRARARARASACGSRSRTWRSGWSANLGQDRRGPDQPPRATQGRELPVRRLRSRLR